MRLENDPCEYRLALAWDHFSIAAAMSVADAVNTLVCLFQLHLPGFSALTLSKSHDETIKDEMTMKKGINFWSWAEGAFPEFQAF